MKKDSKTILEKIKKVVLGEELKLAEMALKDGTVVFADNFESGEAVYMLDGEDRIALPVGDYVLADDTILVVATEGVIEEIKAAEEEQPMEEEMSEEDLEKIAEKVDEVKTENEELKKENEKMKAELSKPASEGIKRSPEGKKVGLAKRTKKDTLGMTVPQRVSNAMLSTPFYQNVKLATTESITTTYAGESAGQYISAATLQGSTLGSDLITIKPNIKVKEVVKKVATTGIISAATCDFSPTGTVALTERILTPTELQVNLELCKTDFQADWEAIAMGYSAHDVLPPSFQAFFAEEMAKITNAAIESYIWVGDSGTAGQFDGFVTLATADADVVDEAGTTVTAANVIAEIGSVVDEIPQAVYGQPDLAIYVSPTVYRAYVRALGGFAAAGVGGSGTGAMGTQWYSGSNLSFDGIPVLLAQGLTGSYMIAAQKSNLWYGTGLQNDLNDVRIIDMSQIDGSKNVRFVMRFTAGVQYGIGSDIVLYTPA